MQVPPFYAIIDAGILSTKGLELQEYAQDLCSACVTLVQYRDKSAPPRQVLRHAAVISQVFAGIDSTLIMNDRADLSLLAGFSGVHVGQGDLPPDDARIVLGERKFVGVSTHTEEQVIVARATSADYIAIGPVFATGTKLDAEPVVGLEGVRRARALTTKPLVAIGGITRENARSVIDAGADSVAVISGLFVPGEPVQKVAADFLDLLRQAQRAKAQAVQ